MKNDLTDQTRIAHELHRLYPQHMHNYDFAQMLIRIAQSTNDDLGVAPFSLTPDLPEPHNILDPEARPMIDELFRWITETNAYMFLSTQSSDQNDGGRFLEFYWVTNEAADRAHDYDRDYSASYAGIRMQFMLTLTPDECRYVWAGPY